MLSGLVSLSLDATFVVERQPKRTTCWGLTRRFPQRNLKRKDMMRIYSGDNGDIPRIRDKIGSDYGEGFTALRGGGAISMDVDTLNESLKVRGAERMKYAMHPDQAFGLIYDLDVFIDVREMKRLAWDKVADLHGYPRFNFNGRPLSHIDEMMAEKVVLYIFKWTNDIKEARAIVYDFNEQLIQTVLRDGALTQEGARAWLETLRGFHIPCALVSFFDRNTIESLLKRLGMESKFSKVVAAEDEVENRSQAYLKASIELRRPPEHCAVFCTTVESITAAHNCTMRAVAVVGHCTAPQLSSADLTILHFGELTIYNVRRLFANRGSHFMDLKKEQGLDSLDDKPRVRNAVFPEE